LGGWDGLWALLAPITARKCGRCARHFHAARRDVSAEVAEVAGQGDEAGVVEAFDDEPSPAEAAMLSEVVEQLHRGLGPRDGAILTLALQGYSAAEISSQLARPARTVYRVLGGSRRVWRRRRLTRPRRGSESTTCPRTVAVAPPCPPTTHR
jgi:RNA polymerase sigma-70 factor (ECF subfamily)